MDMKDVIRSQREKLKLTYEEIGKYVGVSKSTVKKWESGYIANMRRDKIQKLAEVLQVDPGYLMGWVTSAAVSFNPVSIVMVPVVGRICCGNGALAYEEIEGFEPTPQEWLSGGDYFYLRAKGDSMVGARIYDGDLLLIRKQPDVENGQIAAVLIEEEAMLKRVYKNNGQLVLQSENPAYPPIFVPPVNGTIIGKLQKIVINF